MKTLASIKKDLEFNIGLSALIETLKTIAVQQYRSLEQKIKIFTEFIQNTESFLNFVDMKTVTHAFLRPMVHKQAVVAVTSDSGFLGGLNMQVVHAAIGELEKIPGEIIVIGEKGKVYAQGANMQYVSFPGIKEEERYGQSMQLRNYIVTRVLEGTFGYVKVVFPRPVSFTVQRVETVSLLPFSSSTEAMTKDSAASNVIMESSPVDIIEYLVYLLLGQRLFEIFGLSRLAEFAARYIHLEESEQKLKEIDKKVRLEYFRVRHEIIDRTMREIFAGRLRHAQ